MEGRMSKPETGKVLTANRLGDGAVVFLTHNGRWVEAIDAAVVALEPLSADALAKRGLDAEALNLVTGSYLVEVERRDGRVRPLHIRERIRTLGPTVRGDLGKQAEGTGGGFGAAA
jgi:hypothetical protein